MENSTQYEFTIPLDLLIDLVANIYVFSSCAQEIDKEFAEQFTIVPKIAESGTWWSLFYGKGFHTALNQLAARSNEIAKAGSAEEETELSQGQANAWLPYLSLVQHILSIWRDTQENMPELTRKKKVLACFTEEIQRIIMPPDSRTMRSQFYEEGEDPKGGSMGDFFAYLDQCPLSGERNAPIMLKQAVAYWTWLDNVRAFRTFAREEQAKNPRVKRMQQAVLLYRLIEYIKGLGTDLSGIALNVRNQAYAQELDLEYVALVADSYGSNPFFNYYEADIFIKHKSLGEAIRAVSAYIPMATRSLLGRFPQEYALILKATALNILKYQHGDEFYRSAKQRGIRSRSDVIAEQLNTVADDIGKMLTRQRTAWSDIEVEQGYVALDLLEKALVFTDAIAQNDLHGRYASRGLIFTKNVLKNQMGL